MSEKTMFQLTVEEEFARNLKLLDIYEKKILTFPKGSLQQKIRGNKIYYNLIYREEGKVKSIYIKQNINIEDLKEQIEIRKDYEHRLAMVKRELDELSYMLKYKGWKNG